MSNCKPLILSVKRKLNSWSTRTLSFVSRLMLIKIVINGITNFWCTTFTLPKYCIKLINSLYGAFLWKETLEDHHTARVSWETITHSEQEGGLGVCDFLSWNKSAQIRLVWMVFFKSGSIWVALFVSEILEGNG